MTLAYRIRTFGLLVALMANIGSAHANLAWSWSFDNYHPVVGQYDNVVLHATLYNDPSSSEVLSQSSIINSFSSYVDDLPYQFVLDAGGFLEQFAGMFLNPGESFAFDFGSYVPIAAPIATGEYLAESFSLLVVDSLGHTSSWTPDRDLYITVEQRDIGELPEPGTLGLLAVSLGAVWLSRRRRI